jgi:hypothetical protein
MEGCLAVATIKLFVNGNACTLHVDDPQMPLLYALRNEVRLRSTPAAGDFRT